VQVVSSPVVGLVPADPLAIKHADPEGPPAAPLPSEPFAPKPSEAEDGCVPQFVPRLALVGTPGDASAVEQVEAFVGSCAEPNRSTAPANDPVAVAIAFARTRESEVDTLDRLASAFADGPEVVGVGVDPSGADGFGWETAAFVGAVARVPGAVADVDPREDVPGAALFELDTPTGSLDAMVAGPTLPGVADAEPPAVEPFGSGWMMG
jgi:hypothetical protein